MTNAQRPKSRELLQIDVKLRVFLSSSLSNNGKAISEDAMWCDIFDAWFLKAST